MTMHLEAEEVAVDIVRARIHTCNRLGDKLTQFKEMWNSPRRMMIARRCLIAIMALIVTLGLGYVSTLV